MNFKQIILILLFLIVFILIGSVGATDSVDINIDNEVGAGETIDYNSFQKIIDDDITGELNLSSNVVYGGDDDLKSISITKNITINGNGHTINAKNNVQIFNINDSISFTINNITLTNGFSDKGAAIKVTSQNINTSTIVANNVIFKNNNALFGGAVYVDGANLILSQCKFINNTANEYAGSVFVKNGTGDVNNCSFIDNYAYYVSTCLFSYNNEVKIRSCSFINNKAEGYTFSILGGNYVFIESSDFINNSALYDSGCVISNSSNIYVVNCTFLENNASKYQSAAFESYFCSNLNIFNCNFTDNVVASVGPVCIYETNHAIISNCIFSNNSAKNAGAIFISGSNVTVKDSFFNNNSAIEYAGALAIQFYDNDGSNVFMDNCYFDGDNHAAYGNYIWNGCVLIIYNSIFGDKNKSCDEEEVTGIINCNTLAIYNSSFYCKEIIGNYFINWTNGLILNNITAREDSYIVNDGFINDAVINVFTNSSTTALGEVILLSANVTVDGILVKPYNLFEEFNLTFYLNGKIYAAVFNNNTDKYEMNYTVDFYGVRTVNASYEAAFNAIVNTASVISTTALYVDINSLYNDVTVTVTVNPKNATGFVFISIGGESHKCELVNGVATYVFHNLVSGNHTVEIMYLGDEYYNASYINASFELGTKLTANSLVKYFRGNENYTVTLTDLKSNPIIGEKVSIKINNISYIFTTGKNGKISLPIGLNHGVYSIEAKYEGIYGNSNLTTPIVILPTIYGDNVTMYYRNGSSYVVHVVDSQGQSVIGQSVRMNINGVFYDRVTDFHGDAYLPIGLNAGTYIVTAENPSNGEKISNIVTVLATLVESKDVTVYHRNGSGYSVKVLDGQGQVAKGVNVRMNINGVFYNVKTDDNGIATLPIGLSPGNYIITAEYNGYKVSNKVIVLPVLTGNDVTLHYRDGTSYKVKLVDGQGNPLADTNVTMNINGVFYYRTTGIDGVADLPIGLLPGQYIITTMYKDHLTSNRVTVLD